MAASDYENRGSAGITPYAKLAANVNWASSTITVKGYQAASSSGDLTVGMAVMIGDEIMRLESIELPTLSVARGCADTIPQNHFTEDGVWFFSRSSGSDQRQYLSTETVTAKLANKTIYGGAVPIESCDPLQITFDWRHIRPYPPGNLKLNGQAWYTQTFSATPAFPYIELTWNNRNRLVQADQLVSHGESDIPGEPDQKCFLRILRSDNTTVGSSRLDISGNSLTLSRSEIVTALGSEFAYGYIHFGSIRNGNMSWQYYEVPVGVSDSDTSPIAVSELVVATS